MTRLTLLIVLLVASTCPADPPKLFSEKPFTSATLAQAANHFIALKEKAAIKELESSTLDWDTDFKGRFSRNERIGWVCRIVFQPKKKEPLRGPAFGGHLLPQRSMPLSMWPIYPLTTSGSTYFVLSEGYMLGGVPENPKKYIKYCRDNGKFRTERVIVPDRDQALKDLKQLRQSKAWKAIKWEDSGPGFSYKISEEWIWQFLKKQAEDIPKK